MGVEVTGEQAAEPSTTVQHCVSTFVSGRPLDIFKETVGQFPGHVCGDKRKDTFDGKSEGHIMFAEQPNHRNKF